MHLLNAQKGFVREPSVICIIMFFRSLSAKLTFSLIEVAPDI